jgi:hypothetical protein
MTTVHITRAEAVLVDGQRRCAFCGDFIDPVDWCPYCQTAGSPCLRPHKRLRLRADAAFSNQGCRAEHRASFIRDCT